MNALHQVEPSWNFAVKLRTSIRQLDVERKKSSNRTEECYGIRTCVTRHSAMLTEPPKGFHRENIDY